MDLYVFSILDLLPFFLMGALLLLIVKLRGAPVKKAWACYILLFVFAAIRYGIGYDYFEYMYLVNHQVEDHGLNRLEPLSKVLVEIGHFTHYQVFFIVGSFLTLYPVYWVSKRSSVNPALSLFLFFLHPLLYLNGLSVVRNAIAFSLVFLAIYFLWRKRIIWSLVFVVCASLFHKSAVVALLIFPVYFINNNRILHLGFYLSSFALSAIASVVIGAFASKFSLLASAQHYIMDKNTSGGGTMTIVVNLIAIVNLLLWNRISDRDKNRGYNYLLGLCNVGVCIWNVFLSLDSVLAERLGLYFIQVIIILIPFYSHVVKRKYAKLVRQLSICFFLILFVSYFYINVSGYLQNPGDRMSCIPYQTVFFHENYSNYAY